MLFLFKKVIYILAYTFHTDALKRKKYKYDIKMRNKNICFSNIGILYWFLSAFDINY